MRHITAVAFALLLLCAAGFLFIYWTGVLPATAQPASEASTSSLQKVREELTIEFGKSCLQVGVIGLLGAMLTLRIERHRTSMQAKEQLLSTLNTTYSRVKQIRRKIKHFDRDPDRLRPALSNLQLDLEILRKNVDSSNVFSEPDRIRLFNAISRMESFLNRVVKDMKDANSPATKGFIQSRPGPFHAEFADQYGIALEVLRAGLLGRLSPSLWTRPADTDTTHNKAP